MFLVWGGGGGRGGGVRFGRVLGFRFKGSSIWDYPIQGLRLATRAKTSGLEAGLAKPAAQKPQ